MRRPSLRLPLLAATLGVFGPAALPLAHASDAPGLPGLPTVKEEIAWQSSLAAVFEQGQKEGKPILIAINAARVDGGRPEPAGAMLRDEVYKVPAVVEKSKAFACVLLRSDGNSADYGELRSRYGIDGEIVSPQHILAYPDGTLIQRKEYWEPRGVDASVEALVGMMEAALVAHRAKLAHPSLAVPSAGGTAEQRAAWLRDAIERVRQGSADPAARDAAITELVRNDKGGDCIEALLTVLADLKKDLDTRVAILKALGRPRLELAVAGVAALLDDREDDVRSNAAVTLEYIGSARALEPLTKRLGREKEELVHNNLCRALGRCGAGQEAVRKLLVREMATAKSDRTMAGPVMGLAYFEKDVEVARAIEKAAKKEGSHVKRGFLLWALAEVRDPKSAEFVKREILPIEKNQLALAYDNAVYAVLAGDDDGAGRQTIDRGMGYLIGSIGGVGGTARRNRDDAGFSPKGDFAPPPGGGRGPGGMGG